MFLWGFFRSLDGGESVIDARRLLSAQRFFLRWESRSALPCLHAHCPCALRGVWVVTVRPSSCLSSDRSPAVCRSSVECTAAFCDCTTRQQDMSSPFSPACMALSPLPAPCLVAVSVFVQLHPLLLSDWPSCCPLAVLCPCVQLAVHLQVPPPRRTPRCLRRAPPPPPQPPPPPCAAICTAGSASSPAPPQEKQDVPGLDAAGILSVQKKSVVGETWVLLVLVARSKRQ